MPPRHIDQLESAVATLRLADDGSTPPIEANEVLAYVGKEIGRLKVTQHPLGFMHFDLTPLLDLKTMSRIRLHLWNDDSVEWQDRLGLIHDHTWALNSLVLIGELIDISLEAHPDSSGDLSGARVWYGSGPLRIELLEGRFALQETHRRKVAAGRTYRLHSGILHTSDVRRLPTVTLVIATPDEVDFARVFGPGKELAGERHRPEVSGRDARAAILAALAQAEA